MAAQAGASLVLKIGDGTSPEAFTTVAGMKNVTLTINKEVIDITNQGSAGRWREYLGAVALKSIAVSGSGVFTDTASEASLKTAAELATGMTNFQIVVPDYFTWEGAFHVTSLEYSGEDTDAVQFSVSLESGGAITASAA